MEDYPRALMDLEKRFATEDACLNYLANLRWGEGFHCPRCQYNQAWKLKSGLWECASCGHQTSVTAGTIFQNTRKPLVLWFRVIWWVTSQKIGASALGLQRAIDIGCYKTAWTWLHKLRRAMVRPGRDQLSGVVQVDETFIGGEKPGKAGRGAAGKALVLIAVEKVGRGAGRIRLRRIEDASGPSLEEAIRGMVAPGAEIQTDGWSGYSGLGKVGYMHQAIRSNACLGEDPLPLCHRQAGLLKRWLNGTHQGAVSHEHLDFYLDEYTFRFNRRTSTHRGKLFYRLLQNAVTIEPTPFQDITKGVRGPGRRKHKG